LERCPRRYADGRRGRRRAGSRTRARAARRPAALAGQADPLDRLPHGS
jgi:hypothetical protein